MKNSLEQLLIERVENELFEIDVEQKYREYLEELYPNVDICGYPMNPVYILMELDNTAFREGLNNWIDSQDLEEIKGNFYDKEEVESIREELENDGAI